MSAKPTLLGLSGPSSSGKTTIARLLRTIFPSVHILHEDDFYLPEDLLPLRAGHRDWDCAAALDIDGLTSALDHLKSSGELPPSLVSKEDQNEVGVSGVSDGTIIGLKSSVEKWAEGKNLGKLIIIDGFLLFGRSVPTVREKFDAKILLRANYADAKRRREARKGYVTLEGFWEDPEGYVDDVVWPGYVEEHAFLFKGVDVDGLIDQVVVDELGIEVCPGDGAWSVEKMLEWVVERVKVALEGVEQTV